MTVGRIASLWRFPVKSFQGEKLEKVAMDNQGVLGDRAFALIDNETGKVVSAKSVKLFPQLLMCRASYVETPKGQSLPPIQITLANGKVINSDSQHVDQVLSDFFGRNVTLAQHAPEDFTIDQFHPDIENLDPAGKRNISTEQKLGSALFKTMGADSPLSPGSFKDVYPVSLITTSTLERMQKLRPETNFSERRFRMNVIVKTSESGFVENDWVGKTLQLGNNVPLKITMPDPRCVMTALAQEGLPRDNDVLRTLVAHNRLDIMGAGKLPCAGVYAIVGSPGMVSVNDKVILV